MYDWIKRNALDRASCGTIAQLSRRDSAFHPIDRVILGAGNPFNPDVPRSNRRTEIGAFSYE
ncbi:hypothetical protein [Pseudomonas sp. ZS1P83]